MQGKGGFLRILEAFISIAIIAGAMSFLYINQIQTPDREAEIQQLIRIVLEKIQSDDELRKAVLGRTSQHIETLETEIIKFIPNEGELEFHFSICEINEICSCGAGVSGGEDCPTDIDDIDVFSDEVSVSVTLESNDVDPKVIRLFVWENQGEANP